MEQPQVTNALGNMLKMTLEHLEKENPALCHKVCELYAKTTKWERELTYDELVLFHKFIEENAHETDVTKFKYGQTK